MSKVVQRLYHLVQSVPEAELRRACNRHYRKYAEGMLVAFAKLKKLKPISRSACQLAIVRYREDGQFRYNISGIKPPSTEKYDFSVAEWTEWLAMRVQPELVSEFSAAEIVAHCLHEMTFFGYTQRKAGAMRQQLDDWAEELSKIDPESLMDMGEFMESQQAAMKARSKKPSTRKPK